MTRDTKISAETSAAIVARPEDKDNRTPACLSSRDPRTISPRQRTMSVDRTKRSLHQDSEEDDNAPPSKCHAHKDDNEFRRQGCEYVRACKYDELKAKRAASPHQPKETPTSQQQADAIPRIIIPATEGFESPVDVAEAIEATLRLKEKLPMKFLHSGQVLLSPPTMEIHDTIANLKELNGKPIHLQSASHDITKGVLLRYPLLMPLSLVQRHPQVVAAERFTTQDGEPTWQVLITVHTPLPGSLDLENWGVFYTRPYSKEPLRSFNCQRFGHHKRNCTLPAKCGIFARNHDTEWCIKIHKEGGASTVNCPNCRQPHHARNKSCTARKEIVDVQQASQHQWMIRHRPSLANHSGTRQQSALAATSTWGNRTSKPQQQQETQRASSRENFPALGEAAQQPRMGSRPCQRINVTRPAPRTQTPKSHDQLMLSKSDLTEMFQAFATTLISMLAKEVPAEAISTLTETGCQSLRKEMYISTAQRPQPPSPPVLPIAHETRRYSAAGRNYACLSQHREKLALGLAHHLQSRSSLPTDKTTTPARTTHLE
ncbi:hypothetical protein O3P69_006429 [Scylla paramamosain]|uniref:Gag-like protein n=1 Tax=Scylla paramamosain TaxID=85552 RepID=A0AAW0U396_SCYPA